MPEALADRAYYAIRELIVSLDLRPGSVVNERELMGRVPFDEQEWLAGPAAWTPNLLFTVIGASLLRRASRV